MTAPRRFGAAGQRTGWAGGGTQAIRSVAFPLPWSGADVVCGAAARRTSVADRVCRAQAGAAGRGDQVDPVCGTSCGGAVSRMRLSRERALRPLV